MGSAQLFIAFEVLVNFCEDRNIDIYWIGRPGVADRWSDGDTRNPAPERNLCGWCFVMFGDL